jgi:hypothetical protein
LNAFISIRVALLGDEGSALAPVLRVGDGVLVGDLPLGEALQADAEAGGVHHDEHRGETLLRLADQIAGRAVVIQKAGRVAVDSHLLLDRAALDAVALAQGAVLVHQELGNDEERDAFDVVGRAGDLGEDEVDDVLAEVVLARGDEDLGAGDPVGAVGLRLGPGAQEAEIGAAMRLGEVHRPGPSAGDHVGEVSVLLLVRPLDQDRGDGAGGEAVIHLEGLVRREQIFGDGGGDGLRKALAAILLGRGKRRPAALDEPVPGLLEAGRGRNASVLVAGAAFLVADPVQRRQHFGSEAAALGQDRLDHVRRRILEAGQVRIALEPEDILQHIAGLADGGGVAGHGCSPFSGRWSRRPRRPRPWR